MMEYLKNKIREWIFSKNSEKEEFLRKCFNYLKNNKIEGSYAEFGVWRGDNLVKVLEMARRKRVDMQFYGFDSFEGLPSDGGVWKKGQFSTSEQSVKDRVGNRVTLIKGWFKDTLPKESFPVSFVWLDSDLYESAVPVLDFCTRNLVDGGLLVIDNWYYFKGSPKEGEQRAFYEWLQKTGFTATEFHGYYWCGTSFIIHKN